MALVHIKISHAPARGLDRARLRQAAEGALAAAEANDGCELTVIVTDEGKLRRLNREYRGIDETTDVLSFADGSESPETGAIYLGDILIAYPVAEARAQAGGHRVESEIELLVIHGTLHLLGFDDEQDERRMEMWEVQGRALSQLQNPIRPEE